MSELYLKIVHSKLKLFHIESYIMGVQFGSVKEICLPVYTPQKFKVLLIGGCKVKNITPTRM